MEHAAAARQTEDAATSVVPSPRGSAVASARQRKRVLIVNCYFDDHSRVPAPRTRKLPKAMGPVYLAGAFAREHCEVHVHCEMYSGPLEDRHVLGWPDLLVLTGLTSSFDRMLHLTAYARTLNKNVVVAAGGPAIRALPRYSRRFFDYCCTGDIEELREVIEDVFGSAYAAEEMRPRFDLAHWIGRVAEVESSRNCNFRCSFCSLTGDGQSYQEYSLEVIERDILAAGKHEFLLFIDNNFYGNNREFFLQRIDLLRELRHANRFESWSALVTNDFFLRDDNLRVARESGCTALFSGVESFDAAWLRGMNKLQNTRSKPADMIRACLDAGIVFLYGLMLDVTRRSIAELREELEFIMGASEITLPAYLSLPVPFPGTPFFHECVGQGLLLPRVALRDLDSTTLVLEPRDSFEEVCRFLDITHSMRGFRRRILKQSLGFAKRYRKALTRRQMTIALTNAALLCFYSEATAGGAWRGARRAAMRRTYVAATEPLDRTYTPAFAVASRYAHYFQPTMLTDDRARVSDELAEDLLNSGAKGNANPPLISVAAEKMKIAPVAQPAD